MCSAAIPVYAVHSRGSTRENTREQNRQAKDERRERRSMRTTNAYQEISDVATLTGSSSDTATTEPRRQVGVKKILEKSIPDSREVSEAEEINELPVEEACALRKELEREPEPELVAEISSSTGPGPVQNPDPIEVSSDAMVFHVRTRSMTKERSGRGKRSSHHRRRERRTRVSSDSESTAESDISATEAVKAAPVAKEVLRKPAPTGAAEPVPVPSEAMEEETVPKIWKGKELDILDKFHDITDEVDKLLLSELEPTTSRKQRVVRFDEKPLVIPGIERGPDQYDLLRDMLERRPNITYAQLLEDNPSYLKQLKEVYPKRRVRKYKLPAVAVNFTMVEDFGAPELDIEVDGCLISRVPVDGGSGVNLMLREVALDLGLTTFEPTIHILRMADQSRVRPVGQLSCLPTVIGGVEFMLNYLVLEVTGKPSFPVLLGRPWLYKAKVVEDWGKGEFSFGKPSVTIPWKRIKHEGETDDSSDGYTTDWSIASEEDGESLVSYLVDILEEYCEADFGFTDPVPEPAEVIPEPEEDVHLDVTDHALGENDAELTRDWIWEQIRGGRLPPVGDRNTELVPSPELRNKVIPVDGVLEKEVQDQEGRPLTWGNFPTNANAEEERVKNIVSPTQYHKVHIDEERFFYLGKTIQEVELEQYTALLREFRDVFAWKMTDITGIPLELAEHAIDLEAGAVPVRQRQYRLNPKYSLMVKADLEKLLQAGFIYPVNHSEWVSALVIVPKKTGVDGVKKIRVCQDFRKLNAATKKDYHPIPFCDSILDHAAGREVYSFLDGFSGYNQIWIRAEDQMKTTFTSDWGTFAFCRMPFGLCNAPGTFQRLMLDIFKDFIRHFMEVFIDDFAVFGERGTHLENLRQTFERCRETNLKLHPGKCFIGVLEGELLGHTVSSRGLEVNLDKVRYFLTLTAPRNVGGVRGFLGCVGYYRRFILAYALIALPLTELLKKGVEFVWTAARQEAFDIMKLLLSATPTLSPPNWGIEFHVTLDASGFCLGAILWQFDEKKRERPIYFSSKQMSAAERNYTTTEREALAVIYACRKYRHYLLGYTTVFHTDHDALKYLVNKPDLSGRLARWILLLQEFTYTVVVKSGKLNSNADFLSRLRGREPEKDIPDEFPDEFLDRDISDRGSGNGGLDCQSVMIDSADLSRYYSGEGEGSCSGPMRIVDCRQISYVKEAIVEDASIQDLEILEANRDEPVFFIQYGEGISEYEDIVQYLTTGIYPTGLSREEKSVFQYRVGPYTLYQGFLFKMTADGKLKRCVEGVMKRKIITALHSEPTGGHFGVESTIKKIRDTGYWWPMVRRDVKRFVAACDPCQRAGKPAHRLHGPLVPIIPLAPFVKWGIDFIGPFSPPSAKKNRYVILATDYTTKWVEARATKKNDAETAASFLFEQVFMRFGFPLELVSDRGVHFLNLLFESLIRFYDVKHRKTTPYNPRANGLTERANGLVCKVLTKVVEAYKLQWDMKLFSAVHAYNTTVKITTGRSPYYMVFGQDAIHPVEAEVVTLRVLQYPEHAEGDGESDRFEAIEDLEEEREVALELTRKHQATRKEKYDAGITKCKNMRANDLVLVFDKRYEKFPGKLQMRWAGPYRIQEVFKNGSLQLQNLDGKIWPARTNIGRVKRYYELEGVSWVEDDEDHRGDAHDCFLDHVTSVPSLSEVA